MSKRVTQTVSLESFALNELPEEIRSLVNKAKEAAENAYAPYSDFLVGVALLLENKKILTGNNQENAAFPAGICAERVALTYAQANYPTFAATKIVVVARKRTEKTYSFITPCGICRQTLSEYEKRFKSPIEIYLLNRDDEVLKAAGIDTLLPFRFTEF